MENTRKVVAEATRMSRERGHEVTSTLLAFLARSFALQEPSKFPLMEDAPLDAEMLNVLSNKVVDAATAEDAPALDTARVQVVMEVAYAGQRRMLEGEQYDRDNREAAQLALITHAQVHEKDPPEVLDAMYRRVFMYVATRGGMEIALHDAQVEAEVMAAMESVFPNHGLRRFVRLDAKEQTTQLQELASIVVGICLFNRALGMGGAGLPDSSSAIFQQAAGIAQQLAGQVEVLEDQVSNYEAVLAFKAQKTKPDEPVMARLRDELTNRWQLLAYVKALRKDVEQGVSAVRVLESQLTDELAHLNDIVGSSSSIQKDLVYPRFDALGGLHGMLVEERRMLDVRQRLVDVLDAFLGGAPDGLERVLMTKVPFKTFVTQCTSRELNEVSLAGGLSEPPILDEAGPSLGEGDQSSQEEAAGTQRMAGRPQDEGDTLELGSFCPVTLAKRGGLLLQADPAVGYVRWDGKAYGFADAAAMDLFAAEAQGVWNATLAVVTSHPELVRVLNLSDLFPTIAMAAIVDSVADPVPVEFACQTPTHFVEKHFDHNYEFSEWALRRRALNMTNLCQKRTHSTQAVLSHFRRENETQVYLPKDGVTQTAVDKGQSMPQKVRYVAGLRGGHEVKMHVLNLDLDLGQPHEY